MEDIRHLPKIVIHSWQRDDIPVIYKLVIELAVFEKEPDAVTTTLDEYYSAYDAGIISGHIAIHESGEIAGMTFFYDGFSTWKGKMLYLEDFFVLEKYRKLGIGKLLFEAYLDEAKSRNVKLLKWQVLDWNEIAIKFYQNYDVQIQTDWWTCRKLIKQFES